MNRPSRHVRKYEWINEELKLPMSYCTSLREHENGFLMFPTSTPAGRGCGRLWGTSQAVKLRQDLPSRRMCSQSRWSIPTMHPSRTHAIRRGTPRLEIEAIVRAVHPPEGRSKLSWCVEHCLALLCGLSPRSCCSSRGLTQQWLTAKGVGALSDLSLPLPSQCSLTSIWCH